MNTPAVGTPDGGNGFVPMPPQPAGVRLPNGRFASMGGGALGHARATEIARMPIARPLVLDDKVVVDQDGEAVLVPDPATMANVLKASEILMNRDKTGQYGPVVTKMEHRVIRGIEDLTGEELQALAAQKGRR